MRQAARRALAIARRFAGELDQRLDLGYLAERLLHERALVARVLADSGPLEQAPQLSLIVPCHGVAARYLAELLASLDLQSYRRFELCACDDGDPVRAAAELLTRRARAEPERYRIVRHPSRRGISAATRSAIALARGEALVFVDEDDLLHPRALEAVARRLADPEVDMVYTDNDLTSEAGFRRRPVHKPAWSPELLLSMNYVNHLVAMRASCYARCDGAFADGFDGCQDWDLCLRAVRAARRVAHVPLPLYHWRARPGSVAEDPAAKPWIAGAAKRVLGDHLRALDPRLELGETPRSIRFRPGTAPRIEHARVAAGADLAESARALDRIVASLDDRALLRVAVEGAPALAAGDPEDDAAAAYAVLPGVGCVWPFRGDRRSAYTVEHGRLEALDAPRGPFSAHSGNVLTGPLHGLTVRAAAVRRAGGFARALDEASARGRDPNLLGAALGLACLRASSRNVAVRGAECDFTPPPLVLAGLPPADPYL